MKSGRLARELGRLLRSERGQARLTQEQLAQRVGVKRQQLARFEAGRAGSTTALADTMFAALGLQLRVAVEPMDAHLDAAIDAATRSSDRAAARLLMEFAGIDMLAAAAKLPARPEVHLDGPIAACVQGVPIVAKRIDLLVQDSARQRFEAWAAHVPQLKDLVAVRFVTNPPEPVVVEFEQRAWRARPIHEVASAFPEVDRVMRRLAANDFGHVGARGDTELAQDVRDVDRGRLG